MQIDELMERIRRLPPAKRQQLDEIVRSLEETPRSTEQPKDLSRDLVPAPSTAEMEDTRREVWATHFDEMGPALRKRPLMICISPRTEPSREPEPASPDMIRPLTAAQRKQLTELARSLRESPRSTVQQPTRGTLQPVRGLLRDLGPAPTADVIDGARRDLWPRRF
jgi:hypothetical protein